MTPKFDNLASLLMEMAQGVRIPDDIRRKVGAYIKNHPTIKLHDIATIFNIGYWSVREIGKELCVQRGVGTHLRGTEHHQCRIRTDVQEDEILDHWLANHDDISLRDLAKWAGVARKTLSPNGILQRAATRRGITLPEIPIGRRPMRRAADRWKKQHATDPTRTGDIKPHHIKDVSTWAPEAPTHRKGGGRGTRDTKPPMDIDKRL